MTDEERKLLIDRKVEEYVQRTYFCGLADGLKLDMDLIDYRNPLVPLLPIDELPDETSLLHSPELVVLREAARRTDQWGRAKEIAKRFGVDGEKLEKAERFRHELQQMMDKAEKWDFEQRQKQKEVQNDEK